MNDPIQQLLQAADEQQPVADASNASDLTDRILKMRNRRRNTRLISSVALLAISVTILFAMNHKDIVTPNELVLNPKPALSNRIEVETELPAPELRNAESKGLLGGIALEVTHNTTTHALLPSTGMTISNTVQIYGTLEGDFIFEKFSLTPQEDSLDRKLTTPIPDQTSIAFNFAVPSIDDNRDDSFSLKFTP